MRSEPGRHPAPAPPFTLVAPLADGAPASTAGEGPGTGLREALGSPRRLRYLRTRWPWRAVGYLLTGALLGPVLLVALLLTATAGLALAPVLLGLPLLASLVLLGLPFARFERWRLRLVRHTATDPHRRVTAPGPGAWARVRFREPVTWREFGYAGLTALLLWPLEALAVALALGAPLTLVGAPALMATVGGGEEVRVLKLWLVTSWPLACACAALGAVLIAPGLYALGWLAEVRAGIARALLGPRDTTAERTVRELSRSRVRLVDAFDAERRRIERDLHDGAQQRLVALTMTLGLARLDAPPGPLADTLARAHDEAGRVLAELRELIHDIHPKVLTDFGLEAAVQDAADRSPVPVDVVAALPGRLPGPVEAAAYFVTREALANVARHSGAHRAKVAVRHAAGTLVLEVDDDGRGGADPAAGSGLTGLGDRVSALDGTLTLSSPSGGPTLLRVEIPCRPTERTRPS
ncbi:sensor domain-containing protein [Streptomyces sp. NPDC059816]|uniref:sensor histidine kinase n=1 Tax=Streptomyces sp. NPDC059816 TaxID=3346960 RepID=UPI00364DDEB8